MMVMIKNTTVPKNIDNGDPVRKRNKFHFLLPLVTLVFCYTFSSCVLTAQTTTSTIEGTVKDANGALVAGATVKASSPTLSTDRTVVTDSEGVYRIVALPAGEYTVSVTQSGFAESTSKVELTLNRTLTLDFQLQVGQVSGAQVSVTTEPPLVDTNTSATGTTITPRQIAELPVNGRDYLDLLQLVPGVAINRQADTNSDSSNPVLGERSGNNNFLIDGQPNKDMSEGGPGAQFNQETIAEFQVLTTGYKAEFGQASGGLVNVITKSGANQYHGVFSFFLRNDALDSLNSLDATRTEPPDLARYDTTFAIGGPIIKDKFFFFGSAERITERRELDFKFPDVGNALVNQLIRDQETSFDNPSRSYESRLFLKLDQTFGRHRLTEEMNYTNRVVREFLPLSQSGSLPSRRNDTGARRLLLGFADTMMLGDLGDPWLVILRAAYRSEPSDTRPSHPEAGGSTRFFPFTSLTTGTFFGDLPMVAFGNPSTPFNDFQKYTAFSAQASKRFGDHDIKFGWNFLKTKVDGVVAQILDTQLFATATDFATYGPVNAGFFTVTTAGGLTPEANELHLDNNYNGLFVQDEWKIRNNLTVNLGVRWDHDSEFKINNNFSPRLGVAWAVTPKTVIRSHFGFFYDNFRLGLASLVPEFGGADRRVFQPFSYPRGFYGVPTMVVGLVNGSLFPPNGMCVSTSLTDAQIASTSATCPTNPAHPYIGVDRLHRVVASGRPFIPANSPINVSNIQTLSGLTPDQYLAAAAAAVGMPTGFFFWGPFGALTHGAVPPQPLPTAVDENFATPHTVQFSIGFAREIGRDMVFEADYHHREMKDLLGLRQTNLGFRGRVNGRAGSFDPPFAGGPITTYGPFYEGDYDALVLNLHKRFSNRYTLGASYTFASATDNNLGVSTLPSDSFVGIAPTVTETSTGRSNATSSFIAANGNFVAAAGTFVNGPDLDRGPSDLSLRHIFQVNGLVELPWQIQIGGIFRSQSGFHFSRNANPTEDPDGNGTFNLIDHGPGAGRNAFTAPAYVNLDMRFSKRFDIGERVRLHALFEFFNLFNRKNAAAVEQNAQSTTTQFGKALQVLPAREGQFGIRIEF